MAAARQLGFNWDQVKQDKNKSLYLGNSIKAATGHWIKHKDPLFYTKLNNSHSNSDTNNEKSIVKLNDDIKRNEMLGLPTEQLKQQLNALLNNTDNNTQHNNATDIQHSAADTNAEHHKSHKSRKHKKHKHRHRSRSRSPSTERDSKHDRHRSKYHKRSRSRSPTDNDHRRSRSR